MLRNQLTSSWRVYLVIAALLLAWCALVARLFYVHFLDAEHGSDFLKQRGDSRVMRVQPIAASRGEIYDRHGNLLAYSTPVKSIWAEPSEFNRDHPQLAELAALLNTSVEQLVARVERGRNFVYLKRQLSPALAKRIIELGVDGIYQQAEYKRYYPAAEVTAHVVGFTDVEDRGQEGMELAFDDMLHGDPGERRIMRNGRGGFIRDLFLVKEASAGESLTLSIDADIQYLAYRELKSALIEQNARSGSIVVLDVATGEILALVSQPSYNVNDRSQLLPQLTRNRALLDVFEPGSTIKPFTVAVALESEKFKVTTPIDTSPGYIRLDKKTIVDPKNYGVLSMGDVLIKSSQVGTTKIALSVEIDQLRGMLSRAGFGEFCATGFPGEQVGYLPHQRRWLPLQRAALSFGHGMSVNVVQLARAYLAIAADGMKKPVSLLRTDVHAKTVGSDREERVMQIATARQLRETMTQVVERGTGTSAKIDGYSVAGKTGTTHNVGATGYEDNRYRATFAGMVPADNPKYVAVVTIDDPKGMGYYGGEVAAPIFAKVMKDVLRLRNVPPDRPQQLGKHYVKASVFSSSSGVISRDESVVEVDSPRSAAQQAVASGAAVYSDYVAPLSGEGA